MGNQTICIVSYSINYQVKSGHEVSGYGQLKYIIPEILPLHVEKVSGETLLEPSLIISIFLFNYF